MSHPALHPPARTTLLAQLIKASCVHVTSAARRRLSIGPAQCGLAAEPNPLPTLNNGVMSVQSRNDFIANWDRQMGCTNQYDPAAAEKIFDEMLESDPVGATWGEGARRAPSVPTWGFNQETVATFNAPYLMIAGEHDAQVAPARVRELYEDLGSENKVLVDLACSSHNAMWEKNRQLVYDVTVQWLRDGKVNGLSNGIVRLGD